MAFSANVYFWDLSIMSLQKSLIKDLISCTQLLDEWKRFKIEGKCHLLQLMCFWSVKIKSEIFCSIVYQNQVKRHTLDYFLSSSIYTFWHLHDLSKYRHQNMEISTFYIIIRQWRLILPIWFTKKCELPKNFDFP